MTWRPARAALVLTAFVAAIALVVTSCGGGGSSSSGSTKNDLTTDVASYDLAVGPPSRITVGLQIAGNEGSQLIAYGTVDMRFTYLGTRAAPTATTVFGAPSTASFLVLPGSNPPNPMPTAPKVAPANEARGVYATQAAFDKAGFWGVEVDAKVAGVTHRGRASFEVVDHHAVPAPGDQALATQNLTLASTDVPKAAIDSRAGTGGDIPDPELHQTTIAAALAAHRPAVVVFSTPVFCQSQFCGPVTDMVDDLAHQYADRADFIHIEVYKDGQQQILNDAMNEWHMDSEPWVYLIGADGKIVLRLDNVATRGEIEPYLQRLPVLPAG